MNSVSYQLVSKHSILSARRKNRDAAGAPRGCNSEEEVTQFWKRNTKGGGRQSRRDHAPCRRRRSNALSEKDYEIYLDMKLQWLHQFYITAKSSKPEESIETEESEKEKFEENRSQGSYNKTMGFILEKGNNGVRNVSTFENLITDVAKSGVNTEEEKDRILGRGSSDAKPEEEMTPKTLDEGATMAAAWPSNDLGEIFLSRETDVCDREEVEEKARRIAGVVERIGDNAGRKRMPEEEDGGATVEMVEIVRDAGKQIFSLVEELCEKNWETKEAGTDCVSWELGFWTESIGQAQYMLLTPPQLTYNRGVLQEKIETSQKKEDLIFNSRADSLERTRDPLNTLLMAENMAFDSGHSFYVLSTVWSSCFKLWDPGGRLIIVCLLLSSP